MVIELIKRNGPINATPLTSKLLLIVAPTRGKKPYKPGREKTAYKIAEKNQFSEALKISKPSDKIIPSFNDSESSNNVVRAVAKVRITIIGPTTPKISIILFKPSSNVIVAQNAINPDPTDTGNP